MTDQDIDRHAEKARNAYFGVSRRGPIQFGSIHPQSQQIWREVVKAVLSEATPAPAQPDPLHVANERGEGEPVAWVRLRPDGSLTTELLPNAMIEPVRKTSGAWLPLYSRPAAPKEKP